MLHKFPKQASQKWNRFSKIEKVLLIYYIGLIGLFYFLPLFQITNAYDPNIVEKYTIFNGHMLKTGIVVFLSLVFLLLWNGSFSFKRIIHTLVGFKENEALLNFIVLWFISFVMLSLFDTITFVKSTLTQLISISSGYYILISCLILGLISNLLLAVTYAKNRKKSQIVNISKQNEQDQQLKEKEIRGLFE